MKYDKRRGCCTVPFSVNISVTEYCPLNCPMCFQPFGKKSELELSIIYTYLDELSSLGTRYVQFSGGEPLAYTHLLQAILYAKKKGLKTRISTSGVGLTKQLAEQLREVGLDYCHLSLNGSIAAIHELTRSGFKETLEALQLLSESQVPNSINWVANHVNIPDLPKLIGLAKSYNVKHISLLSNKKSNSDEVLYPLSYEDLCKLKQHWQENPTFLIIENCFYSLQTLIRRNNTNSIEQGCRAGRFYMAISAQNEFSPCPHVSVRQKSGGSIDEYWNNNAELTLMREMLKTNRHTGCQGCISQNYCTPCLSEMYIFNTNKNNYGCSVFQEDGGSEKK